MAPGVPREAQRLVCVCANEFGDVKDRGEHRETAGDWRSQSAGALSFLPAASKLFSAISWVFASESQVLARTSHAHLFWLSSPRFALRRHSLASMRLSLLWDIAAMMIPKAYLFLSHCRSHCRSALATDGQAKGEWPRPAYIRHRRGTGDRRT